MADRSLLSSSAVMAAGTLFSRMSGSIRMILLVAALGGGLHGDIFNLANVVPNMIYILVAGGVFNAVLVPQLVRSMERDPDGGDAYANRIITLAALFLGIVTVAVTLAAPYLMQIYLQPKWQEPQLAAQRQSLIAFAYICLPQIFFYGMFTLVGQILNARKKFGPMMWAPISNNVVAVVTLIAYLAFFGTSDPKSAEAYTNAQVWLLGGGTTLGIVVQLLILIPYLKAAGFRYRPRFDFRGTGLGHTLRLGVWTLGFVLVNQIALAVVYRIGGGGNLEDPEGTGITIYQSSFLLMQVPHAIITVSLATAMMTQLSAQAAVGNRSQVALDLSSTMRICISLTFASYALILVGAPQISQILFGIADSDGWRAFVPTMTLFPIALMFFTVHYLMLRGFYSLEQNKVVFWIQCAIAATNIIAAYLLTSNINPAQTSPRLVLAYVAAYVVGSAISFVTLSRMLGGLRLPTSWLLRVMLALALAGGAAWVVREGLEAWLGSDSYLKAFPIGFAIATTFALGYLTATRALRITEVNEVAALAISRARNS